MSIIFIKSHIYLCKNVKLNLRIFLLFLKSVMPAMPWIWLFFKMSPKFLKNCWPQLPFGNLKSLLKKSHQLYPWLNKCSKKVKLTTCFHESFLPNITLYLYNVFIRCFHEFSATTYVRIFCETEFVYLFLCTVTVKSNIHFCWKKFASL